MTIAEAIQRLHNLQSLDEFDLSVIIGDWYKGIKDNYDEALQMAIEALKKQDDEPVGCYGCVHERHGNQVCDACSRSCLDRYVGGRFR